MATKVLGTVALIPKGVWASGTYNKNEYVYHTTLNASYVALHDGVTSEPSGYIDTVDWHILCRGIGVTTDNNFTDVYKTKVEALPTAFPGTTGGLALMSNLTNDTNVSNVLIAPFFKSDTDKSSYLYISSDGKNFKRISDKPLYVGGDSSIIYKNGAFYVVCSHDNPSDFRLLKSTNLKDWEIHDISVGLYNSSLSNHVWAPEWFVDSDGKIYVTVSVSDSNTQITDAYGSNIWNFSTYIIDCDINTITFSNPRKITLEPTSKIDSFMTKFNGFYYLFIKDEYDKKPEIWKSSSVDSGFTKQSDNIDVFNGDFVEGLCITEFDGIYYLYAEKFNKLEYVVSTTTDFVNFTQCVPVNTSFPARHGTILNVKDKFAKSIISDYENSNVTETQDFQMFTNLDTLMDTNNVIETLVPRENWLYQADGSHGTITINNVVNTNHVKKFYVSLRSDTLGAIVIKANTGIEMPADYIIAQNNGNNNVLCEFVWVDILNVFKPTINSRLPSVIINDYAVKNCHTSILLNTLFTSGTTISTFAPINGALYLVEGAEQYTITGISGTYNVGDRFFISLATSSEAAFLKINTILPHELTLSVANSNHDVVYEIINTPIGWRVMGK